MLQVLTLLALKKGKAMREADKNRLRRAKEHLEAAVRHIDGFKWENRTNAQERWLSKIRAAIVEKEQELDWLIDEKIK